MIVVTTEYGSRKNAFCIDRYITQGSFMFTLQTLLSQQSKLTDLELENAGIGRYTHIDDIILTQQMERFL